MNKSQRLRLDSLVLSKEGLPVCPRLLPGSAEPWERLLSTPRSHPPRVLSSHLRGSGGRLTHPQSLELHPESLPEMHDPQLPAQSCMSRSTQHPRDIDLNVT